MLRNAQSVSLGHIASFQERRETRPGRLSSQRFVSVTVSCSASLVVSRRSPRISRSRASCRAHRRTWVHLGLLGAPLGASAEQPQDDSDYTEKARRLLDDPEVKVIRELQRRVQLVDAGGRARALPELLRPGSLLYDADLVCVGEIHDSAPDHAMQRLLIDALTYRLFLDLRESEGVDAAAPRGRTPQNLSAQRVAVGVEYFSRRQQATLDKLIFDKSKDGLGSSPSKFRAAVDWDEVWSYDWDIYAPLFRFCQLNLNRIIGLNLPLEAVLTVSKGGLDSAPDWLREQLPPLDLSKPKHRRRFEDMLQMPLEDAVRRMDLPVDGWSPKENLNNMYQAQVLWDEFMADTALAYLNDVGGRLVALAGANHVWRDAIPERFERQAAEGGAPKKAVTIVPWRGERLPPPGAADFLLRMDGAGGGDEIAAALQEQRQRLRGQPRVFPAGYL